MSKTGKTTIRTVASPDVPPFVPGIGVYFNSLFAVFSIPLPLSLPPDFLPFLPEEPLATFWIAFSTPAMLPPHSFSQQGSFEGRDRRASGGVFSAPVMVIRYWYTKAQRSPMKCMLMQQTQKAKALAPSRERRHACGESKGASVFLMSPYYASGAIYHSTAQKWQALPAMTKRCHSSWNPNTPGSTFGRFSPYTNAPAV